VSVQAFGSEQSYLDPPAAPYAPSPDPDTVAAFELALRLHEGRYRKVPQVVRVANPAAGADWAASVTPGATWVPLAFAGTFTTSAVVANRAVELQYNDRSRTFFNLPPTGVQAASLAWTYCWARETPIQNPPATALANGGALPPFSLFGGLQIKTATVNIDAADQWTNVTLLVLEVTEAQLGERAEEMQALVTGAHADLFPGFDLGF
jgi:hypothetical protein